MDIPQAGRETFDAVIIGAGQAAKPLALALGDAGWKTAVIERKEVGGSCINFGCTPTKTMIASARVAHLSRRASEYGVSAGPVNVDFASVTRRAQTVVERFRSGVRDALESAANVELIFGHAAFAGRHEIDVNVRDGSRRRLTARRIFIDTGTRTARPRIPGLDQVPALDPGSVLRLDRLPEHLLVIGGGYIGLEFGQMFRRFGSQVSIIQHGSQLLGREDADVAEAVRQILANEGINIYLNANVAAARTHAGGVALDLDSSAGRLALDGSHVLLAAGRVPNSDDLNLAAAGVETEPGGYIRVNERLETNVDGIYAVGDVKGGPAFTHVSYDDYRVIKANLMDGANATINARLVPYAVFIDPQLGRIGMTETEARKSGRPVSVARLPMAHVARAIESGETQGFMKAVVDAGNGQILGCAILGAEGGELMSMLQLAMMGGIGCTQLRDAMFAHPTLAESLNNLFDTLQPLEGRG